MAVRVRVPLRARKVPNHLVWGGWDFLVFVGRGVAQNFGQVPFLRRADRAAQRSKHGIQRLWEETNFQQRK